MAVYWVNLDNLKLLKYAEVSQPTASAYWPLASHHNCIKPSGGNEPQGFAKNFLFLSYRRSNFLYDYTFNHFFNKCNVILTVIFNSFNPTHITEPAS